MASLPPQSGRDSEPATRASTPFDTLSAPVLQALLDPLAQTYWETDATGRAVIDSPSWRAQTGQTLQQWLEQGWTNAVHPDDQARAAAQWQQAIRNHTIVDVELRLLSPDGTYRWTNVRAVPIRRPNESIDKWVGINIDIHARKTAEQQRAFLLHISDTLRPLSEATAIRTIVMQETMAYLSADRCYYCEIQGEQAVVQQGACRADLPSVAGEYSLDSLPIFRTALATGQPLKVTDVHVAGQVDETLRQQCIALKIISFLNVPLIKAGRPVGILCVTQCTPRQWSQTDVELVQELAERTWAAVERGRAEEALRESERFVQGVIRSLPLVIYIFDLVQGQNHYLSPQVADLFGYTAEQMQATGKELLKTFFIPTTGPV